MSRVCCSWAVWGVAIAALALASPARGAISFTGTVVEGGTGFGNVYDVLALQVSGQTTTEFGAVVWDGSADVLSGDATNQSQTYLVADLVAGINPTPGLGSDFESWGLILNINQTGSNTELGVSAFDLIVFNLAGTEIGRLSYEGLPLLLDPDDQGTGSAGFLFDLSGLSQLIADAGGADSARIGMEVPQDSPFTNANDGPDVFYLGNFPSEQEPELIPEPTSVAAWGVGLALLGGAGVRRRLLRRRESS